jgi:hypothetical protein
MHECPKNGCARKVPFDQFACKTHWFAITAATRRAIWQSWRAANPTAHRFAMQTALIELNGRGRSSDA